MPKYTVQEIAQHVDGSITGASDWIVIGLSRIEYAEADTCTFYNDKKYHNHLYSNLRRVVLIPASLDVAALPSSNTYIKVDDPLKAINSLAKLYDPREKPEMRVAKDASISVTAKLSTNIHVGARAHIGASSTIGADTTISAQAYVGDRCQIGQRVYIYPGVRIMDDTVVGDDVIIHPNAVIGSDGFGYRYYAGEYQKIVHIGNVIIENKVEIGANACIDRGSIGSTIIRTGAKIDNLVHIAHNVEIGQHVAIAAQSGISGSSTIGSYSQLGGQTGVVGHISIAPGSRIQAQSGVASSIVTPQKKWYGYPAMGYWNYLRSFSIFRKLPQWTERIKRLEQILSESDKK